MGKEVEEIVEVFFFKQKTAYEIYQCDWSADVCYSDLRIKKRQPRELLAGWLDLSSKEGLKVQQVWIL